ncbi:Transcription factor SPT8 [Termitomyces sp. J132]|nr:Transcription factor SPT8 [Termitomyces sp. J132]
MVPSDSEDEILEDLEYDVDDEPEAEGEEEPLEVGADDATEGDDESASDDSDDGSEEEDDDDNESEAFTETAMDVGQVETKAEPIPDRKSPSESPSAEIAPPKVLPPTVQRSLSPAKLSPEQLRKNALMAPIGNQAPLGSYTVEAICALPHPVPTHALASSFCMTHLLTGSDDGYIRDYDIFSSANSKNFLTAPQRHHSGVVEGIMKAGQLRSWWENPALPDSAKLGAMLSMTAESPSLSPVYSLVMHSDALWTLAGTDTGHINLFTTRHDPGRVIYTMTGHRGPVSALSMSHDEKGFYSAGWDGDAIVDEMVTHLSDQEINVPGSAISSNHVPSSSVLTKDSDTKSDASFDPLFDDEPEDQRGTSNNGAPNPQHQPPKATSGTIPPPKNTPPLLDSATYATYSPDILMTASIDGQIIIWDRRIDTLGSGVGRLWMSEKTPPWCLSACWSADGGQIYAGRRNGTVDVWDVRLMGLSGPRNTPRLLKTLKNPLSSGVVSCVVAFPDCRHIACASVDNLRLWNVAEASELDSFGKMKSGAQFKIIPGHHGAHISQMLVDPGARFLVSASSNRGWHGDSTRTVFVHDIKHAQ